MNTLSEFSLPDFWRAHSEGRDDWLGHSEGGQNLYRSEGAMNRRNSRDVASIPPIVEALLIAVLFAACLVGSAL